MTLGPPLPVNESVDPRPSVDEPDGAKWTMFPAVVDGVDWVPVEVRISG